MDADAFMVVVLGVQRLEHRHEVVTHLVVAAARRHEVLAAGDLGGFAEDHRHVVVVHLVKGVADRRVGTAARRGIGLTALGGHPQLGQRGFLALQLRRPVHVLTGRLGGTHDGVVIAVQLDAEAGHRLAGGSDAGVEGLATLHQILGQPPMLAVLFLGMADHPLADPRVGIGGGVDVDETVFAVEDDDVQGQEIEDLR